MLFAPGIEGVLHCVHTDAAHTLAAVIVADIATAVDGVAAVDDVFVVETAAAVVYAAEFVAGGYVVVVAAVDANAADDSDVVTVGDSLVDSTVVGGCTFEFPTPMHQ